MAVKEMPQAGEKLRMTYEEFLAWAGEDVHAEWVNGEVIVHMTAKQRHQEVVQFLFALFDLFNQFLRVGRFFTAPYQMKLASDGPGREPDILFVTREREALVKDQGVQGPADLVIEIVSDDSVTRDRVDKFEEYEQYGVREYWIIDPRPRRPRAEFYQLDESGQYQPVPVGKDGVYHSKVLPGFWLRVDWLWADTLPDSLFVFAEIANLPADVVQTLRNLQRP
jgi:Uma2 family endonuclease